MKKLVIVTINGITRFLRMSPDSDGKFRLSHDAITRIWGIKRGEGICFK